MSDYSTYDYPMEWMEEAITPSQPQKEVRRQEQGGSGVVTFTLFSAVFCFAVLIAVIVIAEPEIVVHPNCPTVAC